jgi:integrase
VARRAQNNPRQIRAKSCGCKLCTEKFRPGEQPTRRDCTGPWQARYRDPAGKQKAKNFPTKKKAEAFLDSTRTDVRSGSFVDPARGNITCRAWYEKWAKARRTGETTSERNWRAWNSHVEPHFGDWRIGDIGYLDVEEWITKLTKVTGVPTIIKAFRVLDPMLGAAVRDRRIPHNPCEGVKLPEQKAKHPEDLRPPTYDQLAEIRRIVPKHHHALLIVAEETGLRWGELIGLRRCHVNLKARTMQVREVIIEVRSHPKRKAYPKSSAGFRTVPLTDRAVKVLKEHLKKHPASDARTDCASGMHKEELIFRTAEGCVYRSRNFRRVWDHASETTGIARKTVDPVTKRTQVWPHLHDIRHAFASRLHAAGVPEADVQAIMGHERGGRITWLYTHASTEAADRVLQALSGGGESTGESGRPALQVVS